MNGDNDQWQFDRKMIPLNVRRLKLTGSVIRKTTASIRSQVCLILEEPEVPLFYDVKSDVIQLPNLSKLNALINSADIDHTFNCLKPIIVIVSSFVQIGLTVHRPYEPSQ